MRRCGVRRFAFAFRVGAGFRFGVTIGFDTARALRVGVVDVVTGRVAGAGLDGRATVGEGSPSRS